MSIRIRFEMIRIRFVGIVVILNIMI